MSIIIFELRINKYQIFKTYAYAKLLCLHMPTVANPTNRLQG